MPAPPIAPAENPANPIGTLELLYAGTADGVEADLVQRAAIPFEPIAAGQLRIYNPIKLARNAVRLVRGSRQAQQMIHSWRPDVLFVTGGYVCAPVVWAAHRQGVPVLIYLPDITPGMAVQRLARYAERVAVSFPEVAEFFPGKAIVTGYPVRPELTAHSFDKHSARTHFDLDPTLATILVFGGSRGSRSINIALANILPSLLQSAQVIHVSGEVDWEEASGRASELPVEQRTRYRLYPYLHEDMITALVAADLAITRAGASVLGEFPALALPSILVPLPISGQHQYPNARYLADRNAALIVEDANMNAQLLPAITELLDHPMKLAAMSDACAKLARPNAAADIAQTLFDLAAPIRT
ncbi:MAG: UDP-N-acetylglucosamine--N-acetylmuramyl-(pentapeptide) pyrophosphoryl-undecaprenol N-acetylglucosamine transferase [Caldilineales bacterium]|nr:UDP-N-acetylglucosamine--N-acetylmuramyl-(pentapeptide) pyrophosphoryl-undecaprenol N-acetylglucosamine transferase [Caldilineales bacterium]